MSLSSGAKLGPYEILSKIGAGGMGEVYRARDTRLERTVAIKVLPSEFSRHAELRKRLEREARALSSLTHPHICSLYDVGQQDGVDFLVMEYLEGQTLGYRLLKGALPAGQVLQYGIEMADALDRAHRLGIVHRDLKPGNIMLTKDGAKLLDFGLARVEATAAPSNETLTLLETQDHKLTEKGVVLGTFQYMAPEQLEGKEADARTDIFALGAVIYEMATGKTAFSGNNRTSLITAILASEPPAMTSLQPLTPLALERVLKTCLAKDPDARWQSAQDLKLQLEWIAEGGSQAGLPAPVAARRRTREQFAWAFVGLLTLALITVSIGYVRRAPQLQSRVSFIIDSPPEVSFDYMMTFAISPDGRQLAYIPSDGKVWVQRLDEYSPRPMPGTEEVQSLFWSPDSRFLGLATKNRLKRLEPAVGRVETLCDVQPGLYYSWNKDAVVLGARLNEPITRVNLGDCKQASVTELDSGHGEVWQFYPTFLPDSRRFLYLSKSKDEQEQGSTGTLYVGSLDSPKTSLLLRRVSNTAYVAPGYLLFANDGSLVAQPLDVRTLQVTGEALSLREPQAAYSGGDAFANFSVSGNGVLVYQADPQLDSQLQWVDRSGKKLQELLPPGRYQRMRLSPDGKQLLIARLEAGDHRGDYWVWDMARKIWTRVTEHSSPGGGWAIWSPDKCRIAFSFIKSGILHLYLKDADGSAQEELLLDSANWMWPLDWSPDGQFLLYMQEHSTERGLAEELWAVSLAGERKTLKIASSVNGEARFSPDGRSVVYVSDKSGRNEIYLQAFPNEGLPWQVSTGGGSAPRWSRSGKEIFFISADSKLMAAQLGPNLHTGTPEQMFDLKRGIDATEYEVGPEGRFLLLTPVRDVRSFPLHVVMNWIADLKH
jgi:serine/threonine protein kinase